MCDPGLRRRHSSECAEDCLAESCLDSGLSTLRGSRGDYDSEPEAKGQEEEEQGEEMGEKEEEEEKKVEEEEEEEEEEVNREANDTEDSMTGDVDSEVDVSHTYVHAGITLSL